MSWKTSGRKKDLSKGMLQASLPMVVAPTTPIRPKIPGNDAGDNTPARPCIPIKLPNSVHDRVRAPTALGAEARARTVAAPQKAEEIPRCRSTPDSPGVQWPWPTNVSLQYMGYAYKSANRLMIDGKDLSKKSIKDVEEDPEDEHSTMEWTFHEDRHDDGTNNELLELVQMYRDVDTQEIPWEVIGAEMRSLTTEPLVNQYQALLSAGRKFKPYNREEDLTILRTVVAHPSNHKMMFEISKELGPMRSLRSAMRRLLILNHSHHHPQSDIMLARNDMNAKSHWNQPNGDKKNVIIEVRMEFSNKQSWIKMGRRLGMSPKLMDTIFNETDIKDGKPAEWTAEEDQSLVDAVNFFGKLWQEIAVVMRRRTSTSCRKRFEKLMKETKK